MSQGDELMMRKMNNLVNRQQSISTMQPGRTFHFAEQLSPERDRMDSSSCVIPDNWVAANGTGSYFATHSPSDCNAQHATLKSSNPHAHSTSKLSNGSSARLSPEQRQQMLQDVVHQRVVGALEDQRNAQAARLAACKAQREVELMKFHQKMKQRTELQITSNQLIIGHSVAEMGINSQLKQTASSALGSTKAAIEKSARRGEAHEHYLEYNRDRIERNLLHRQYCLEAHREKEHFRQGLEAHVGTAFANTKMRLMNEMGLAGPDATFTAIKTMNEIHQQRAAHVASEQEKKKEREEIEAIAREITAIDDFLWEQRRKVKGQKSIRTREVEYNVDASYSSPSRSQRQGSS